MPQVVWLPQALRDVDRLYRFLKPKNPAAAQKAAAAILKSVEPLGLFPEMGLSVPGKPSFREIYAGFGSSAYVVRYAVNRHGTVLITRVWHGKERDRKPA